MAQYRVVETKRAGQLIQDSLLALDVHEHVMGFVDFVNGVGQLASTPIFEPVNLATVGGNHALIPLEHAGDLLALIRVDQKNHFVMSHCVSLRVSAAQTHGAARSPRGSANPTGAADTAQARAGFMLRHAAAGTHTGTHPPPLPGSGCRLRHALADGQAGRSALASGAASPVLRPR